MILLQNRKELMCVKSLYGDRMLRKHSSYTGTISGPLVGLSSRPGKTVLYAENVGNILKLGCCL